MLILCILVTIQILVSLVSMHFYAFCTVCYIYVVWEMCNFMNFGDDAKFMVSMHFYICCNETAQIVFVAKSLPLISVNNTLFQGPTKVGPSSWNKTAGLSPFLP